ncbi:MAG TPA: hypothetical protein VJ954_04770 [Ignavibacteriaceae bacterium]|nr:hypothetical protein [Ignavibacteriaceae bacterium]
MKKIQRNESFDLGKIPEEISVIFSKQLLETSIDEISKHHNLEIQEHKFFAQLCHEYLYNFDTHINVFKRELSHSINPGKCEQLGIDFKKKIQEPLENALNEYYINLDKKTENIFYESGHFKVTDKFINYSRYPEVSPAQPIDQVSNITIYSNLFKTNHTVTFEVFIPGKGRWGTVDRPGNTFRNRKEADAVAEILKKAVACGRIRLKYDKI